MPTSRIPIKLKSQTIYKPYKVKKKTECTPKETHHTLKTFIDLVQHDVNEIKNKKVRNPKSNLSYGEQKIMKNLTKRRYITITTADKGGAVVIIETKN